MRPYIFIGIVKLFLAHSMSTMDFNPEQSLDNAICEENDEPFSLPSSSDSFFAKEFRHFDPATLTPTTSKNNSPSCLTPAANNTFDDNEKILTQKKTEQEQNISLFQKKIYFKKWREQYIKKIEQEWDLVDEAEGLTNSQTTTAVLAATTPFSQTEPLNSMMKSWSWLNKQIRNIGSK